MNGLLEVRQVSLYLVVILSMVWIKPAFSQIEEVIVTAQKRAEDVQDVPISISTFSGDFMEDSGIDDLQTLGQYTPNLSLTRSSQVANNRIIMRGVGSVGNNAIEPSVAVFIDGVYYPRPASLVGNLTDLEMVEVLRGPQGTLFGRNASMGALNIRTRRPTDELEGNIRVGYGDYNALRISGAAGGGLTDGVAGRLSFHFMDRDGYGKNTFLLRGNDSEPGEWQDIAVRSRLLFNPTDDLEIGLNVDYAKVENQGSIIEVKADTVLPQYLATLSTVLSPVPLLPLGPVPESTNTYDFTINQDHKDTGEDEQWGLAATVDWQVLDHTIRSISAYRDWSNETFESALRLPADLFNRDTDYETKTFSQELQIISPAGQRLEYVAGFYYYDEEYNISQDFDLGPDFCPAVLNIVAAQVFQAVLAATGDPTLALNSALAALAPGGLASNTAALCAISPQVDAIDGEFQQDLTSYALFGQLTFNITDQLRLTGGLRWTKDEKEGSFSNTINNIVTGPGILNLRAPDVQPNLKFDDDELTWLVNASYNITDDIMVFGSYSTGFKSGGFNSDGGNRAFTLDERVFESETVDNFEFGVKSGWFDNRLVANLTYFHTEISDFQDRQFDGVNFIVQNTGELTQQGVELDIQVRPVPQLMAMLGVSYLDSEFDSFPNATNLPAVVALFQSMGLVPPPRDLTGERNHFSPEWQMSLVSEWADAVPGTNLSWFVRGEYQYTGEQNLGAETNQNPQTLQESYNILNARLGVRGQDDKWEVATWVRNATDEEYCQTMFNQPIGTTLGLVDSVTLGGMQRCVLGAPRTWGVEAAYRF